MLNKNANEERRLQLSKLEVIRVEAYKSTRSYKKRAKMLHDIRILRKEFSLGMKVPLYNSMLHHFLWKLRFCWTDPYIVSHIFTYNAVEMSDRVSGAKFKVNCHRLKQFLEFPSI